jgi:hypothetical protein
MVDQFDSAGFVHYIYFGTNQHVYQIMSVNGSIWYEDRTSAAGAPLASAGSALTTAVDSNGGQHFVYLGTNQHVYDAYWNGSYGYTDLTAAAGAPVAASTSALSSMVDPYDTAGFVHFIYIGSNQHVYQLMAGDGSVTYEDRTYETGAPIAAAGSSLTTPVDSNGGQHFVYLGTNQHVYDAYWSGSYGYTDLTATAGAPVAASGSSLSSMISPYDTAGFVHFVYSGANQHIYQLMSVNGTVTYEDRTSAAQAPAATSGTPLSAFFGNNGQHFVYEGTNQHVYDAYWSGGYGFVDLTAR